MCEPNNMGGKGQGKGRKMKGQKSRLWHSEIKELKRRLSFSNYDSDSDTSSDHKDNTFMGKTQYAGFGVLTTTKTITAALSSMGLQTLNDVVNKKIDNKHTECKDNHDINSKKRRKLESFTTSASDTNDCEHATLEMIFANALQKAQLDDDCSKTKNIPKED